MRLQIRKTIQLTFLLVFVFISCKTNPYEGFQKINKEYARNRGKLIEKIVPDEKLLYWEYVYVMPGRLSGDEQIIKKSGNSLIKKKYLIKRPDTGFFIECHPLFCYSYIMYVDQGEIHYVTDEKGLKKFIGKVNNLEEALLISQISGFGFDEDEMKAGSYKKTKKGFQLNLMKYNSCPVRMDAIKAEIDTLGNIKTKNMGTYYKSTDCIVS